DRRVQTGHARQHWRGSWQAPGALLVPRQGRIPPRLQGPYKSAGGLKGVARAPRPQSRNSDGLRDCTALTPAPTQPSGGRGSSETGAVGDGRGPAVAGAAAADGTMVVDQGSVGKRQGAGVVDAATSASKATGRVVGQGAVGDSQGAPVVDPAAITGRTIPTDGAVG